MKTIRIALALAFPRRLVSGTRAGHARPGSRPRRYPRHLQPRAPHAGTGAHLDRGGPARRGHAALARRLRVRGRRGRRAPQVKHNLGPVTIFGHTLIGQFETGPDAERDSGLRHGGGVEIPIRDGLVFRIGFDSTTAAGADPVTASSFGVGWRW